MGIALYQRGSIWWIRLTANAYTSRWSTGFHDRSQAEEVLSAFMNMNSQDVTCLHIIELYLQQVAGGNRDACDALDPILDTFGVLTVYQINRSMIELYIRRRRRYVSLSTVKIELAFFRAALRFCAKIGIIDHLPYIPILHTTPAPRLRPLRRYTPAYATLKRKIIALNLVRQRLT